jgi:hypothetical protein
MEIENLAKELADLQFDSDYRFKNGTAFREVLGKERARGLLKALQDRGYVLTSTRIASPSIHNINAEYHQSAS